VWFVVLQNERAELANDQLEQERRMLEWRLRQQQRQSEEDGRWLAEEESHLVIKDPIESYIDAIIYFLLDSDKWDRYSDEASSVY